MAQPTFQSPARTALQLERLSRRFHARGHAVGLYPAQWSALRYFADAPEEDSTTAGLARFQDINLATVARTVRILVTRGLLDREANPRNRRADVLRPSHAGLAALAQDPLGDVARALAALSAEELAIFTRVVDRLIAETPDR